MSGEAVFLDVTELGGGSLAAIFRKEYEAPRLLVTGCNGTATAVELEEYASKDDGFSENSVGRVILREDGDNDVVKLRGIEEGVVRINYGGHLPKLYIGDDRTLCLYQGEHDHED